MKRKYLKFAKKVFKKVSDPHWWAEQRYIKYYDTLPIDERLILLESEHGKKINGNIFYIAQYLSESYKNYRIYISAVKDSVHTIRDVLNRHGMNNVHITLYSSDEYFRLLASAKYLVNDTTFGSYFIKKEGQIYLNTWHGTPLKAMGRRTLNEPNMFGNVQKNFVVSNYVLFPNEHTRDVMMRDYMLDNLTSAKEVFCGYPRNTIFFDIEQQNRIHRNVNPGVRKLYAYLPTFRGRLSGNRPASPDMSLYNYLCELDRNLCDEELLWVNIHPLAKELIDFSGFRHIQEFPSEYETYEALSICDCLVTDYSSVFFDYAVSGKKIVLFPYDYDEYRKDRGMYFSLEEFPFPKVFDVPQLLAELRSPKQYDDAAFLRTFAPYESIDATEKLIDLLLTGNADGLRIEEPQRNGKENVLIYSGNLSKNGIATSLLNLFSLIDTEKRNYYVTFKPDSSVNSNQNFALRQLPENVMSFPVNGDMNLTIPERMIWLLFKSRILSAPRYLSLIEKRIRQNQLRCFGNVHFDSVIHFNGYESEMILFLSLFDAKRIIYVHNDMIEEIKTKGKERRDVLEYAYRNYDKTAVVTEDLIESTKSFMGNQGCISVCRNSIDYNGIREKAREAIALDDKTCVFPDRDKFLKDIASSKKKFISVGRFSPEKGHIRLINAFERYHRDHPDSCLIIMGGYSWENVYEKTVEHVKALNMEEHISLLLQVSNPFPILKACDAFILSSFYEGFGLVLVEADILGLPAVSTDIAGPRTFMQKHGGTLVESSEEGIYQGLCMLGEGNVAKMNVDYAQYNREVVAEFEALFHAGG